jgi:hypothetical protein
VGNWLRLPDALLPQTLRLLLDLAERDVACIKDLATLPNGQRLGAMQAHLAEEVVPFFCLDAAPMARQVRAVPDEAALRRGLLLSLVMQ